VTPTVAAALEALRGKRAVLIGDLVLDAYVYGETVRVSREAPVLVVRKERTTHRLGGAANTAANLAALGLHTTMVGALADDDGGRTMRAMLEEANVSTEGLVVSDVATPVKTRILAGAFGTTRQQVLRIDDEPERPIGAAVQSAIEGALFAAAAKADVVVVSDYGMGTLSGRLTDAVLDLIEKKRIVTVDSRYQAATFAKATAIMPNVPEAEALAGFPLNSRESIDRAGAAILQKHGYRAVLLTQGRGGMTLYQASSKEHVDIVGADEVTDVTGAGDTVTATFSAALAAGLGMSNGMKLANVAAGIVVTRLGTATASPDEIIAAAAKANVKLVPWPAS
jgi:rfaE bifunctional protein kinase chain/domain